MVERGRLDFVKQEHRDIARLWLTQHWGVFWEEARAEPDGRAVEASLAALLANRDAEAESLGFQRGRWAEARREATNPAVVRPGPLPTHSEEPEHGHGHVVPRKDGAKARCGGPGLCKVCRKEQAYHLCELPSRNEWIIHLATDLITSILPNGPAKTAAEYLPEIRRVLDRAVPDHFQRPTPPAPTEDAVLRDVWSEVKRELKDDFPQVCWERESAKLAAECMRRVYRRMAGREEPTDA